MGQCMCEANANIISIICQPPAAAAAAMLVGCWAQQARQARLMINLSDFRDMHSLHCI